MGFSLFAYLCLAITGTGLFWTRQTRAQVPSWLRPLHFGIGMALVVLVLLLLAIGIVGTLGHYGSLNHSVHLWVGLGVVVLVLLSAGSATQINPQQPWFRWLHISANLALFIGFALVSFTGWHVVQKYLP